MYGKQNNGGGEFQPGKGNNSKPNKWKIATLSLVGILLILFFAPLGKADLSLGNQFIQLILQSGQTQDPFTISNATGSTLLKIDANSTITINDESGNPSTVMGPRSGVEAASYIIFTDGTNVYAKNGTTGKIQFSGDATTVIQSVLNATGNILFLEGTFNLSKITIKSNTTIRGLGDKTILILKNNSNNRFITNNAPIGRDQNIVLRDMYIDGNKDGQLSIGAGDQFGNAGSIHFENVSNIEVSGIHIVNAWATGVELINVNNFRVFNNLVENSADDGIGINYISMNGTVYGNIIKYAGVGKSYGTPNGIELQDGATNNVVSTNVIIGSISNGIEISNHTGGPATTDNIISGNTFLDNNYSIYIGINNNNNLIIGNNVKKSKYYGISVASKDNLISGNLISDNGAALSWGRMGIAMYGGNNTIIDNKIGNYETANQQYGIYIYAGVNNNIIKNNIFTKNTISSIYNITTSTIKTNEGYITENKNSTSITNGGTIAHGLVTTPTSWFVFPQTVNITASATANSTHLNVNLIYINGTSVTSPINVTWQAEV